MNQKQGGLKIDNSNDRYAYTADSIEHIMAMHRCGYTADSISRLLRISYCTVWDIITAYEEEQQ